MTTLTLNLGAPSHAVEPALLALRLPRLAAALQSFCAVDAASSLRTAQTAAVHVYAAQLGVQRDHITLECLPLLNAAAFEQLQTRAALLANEFAADNVVFTASCAVSESKRESESARGNVNALGVLNILAALPPAANFIGRDIAKALPRDDASRVLRQFVNGAQMALHQSPVQGCSANSLWCGNAMPTDDLSSVWLQGGLTSWWDALPAWDSDSDLAFFHTAKQLEIVFSDVTLLLPLKRRNAWALWSKPLHLATVLQQTTD